MLIRSATAAAFVILCGLTWNTALAFAGSGDLAYNETAPDAYTSQLFLDYLHSTFVRYR